MYVRQAKNNFYNLNADQAIIENRIAKPSFLVVLKAGLRLV